MLSRWDKSPMSFLLLYWTVGTTDAKTSGWGCYRFKILIMVIASGCISSNLPGVGQVRCGFAGLPSLQEGGEGFPGRCDRGSGGTITNFSIYWKYLWLNQHCISQSWKYWACHQRDQDHCELSRHTIWCEVLVPAHLHSGRNHRHTFTLHMLRRIEAEGITVILVAPNWSWQP